MWPPGLASLAGEESNGGGGAPPFASAAIDQSGAWVLLAHRVDNTSGM